MNVGACMKERDGRQCKVSSLMFTDDAMLIVDSEVRECT